MNAIKTSTAIRAWRRSVQLIAVLVLMNAANGNYPVGFAVMAFITFFAIWRLGRRVILVHSRRGILRLNEIL
ncbi:MAG TPA: hypothetical protein PKL77_08630 [Candidatus Omnitrophota bacterium]|nr:hypothetical protein [Candidatus Omnitrophota bacterium]